MGSKVKPGKKGEMGERYFKIQSYFHYPTLIQLAVNLTEPFTGFSLPCPAENESDRMDLVGT